VELNELFNLCWRRIIPHGRPATLPFPSPVSTANSSVVYIEQAKTDPERLGWRVITVWECELREPVHLASRLDAILRQGN